MKKLLQRLLSLLLVLAIFLGLLVAVCFFAIKFSLPGLLRDGLADTTGFPVTMASSSCSVFGLSLGAEGVVIYNPEGFPPGNFAEVESVQANLGRDPSGQLVFKSLSLHLKKLTLANSPSGQLNLAVFTQEAGPLASDALDRLAAIFGQDTFPPVIKGELRVDSVILPDGRPAPGFPRTVPLHNVTSAQNLLRQLGEITTP